MTIRKNPTLADITAPSRPRQLPVAIAARGLVIGAVIASLAGCGMIRSVVGDDKVDYKAAKRAPSLDVPPDLTQLQADNRYSLPGSKDGIATASSYNAARGDAAQAGTGGSGVNEPASVAAAPAGSGMRVERSGDARWLVVNKTPEVLWPQLQQFWQEAGFTLVSDSATAGVMETDWKANADKIPQDMFRKAVGKVFQGLFSSDERDKFVLRVERQPNGGTEIYLTARVQQQAYQGAQKEDVVWNPMPRDPALEAQYLAMIMTSLGGGSTSDAQATKAVDSAIVQPQHAKLVGEGAGQRVEVDEAFDRAWRRVGLALDRAGFTVEDRDRTKGMFYVRYLDPDVPVKTDGFLKKIFSWGSDADKNKAAPQFRISVVPGAGSVSNVAVLDKDGNPDATPTAGRMLVILNDQLK
jgi:outer membrane protein assembly factor BamC